MIRLPATLHAWGTSAFAEVLKRELAAQAAALPLQQAAAATSVVLDTAPEIMFIGGEAEEGGLRVRIGVFFVGIVAGCNCADDPTPAEPQPEYCELELVIDGTTAGAAVRLRAGA